MYKKLIRFISAVLILTFTFTMGLSNITIVSAEESQNQTNTSQGPKNYRSKTHKQIGELTNKRTQNAKYYLNSDGTITEDEYLSSIHYKDNKGNWQDISNKIVPSDEPGFGFANEANSFRTHFANDTSSDYITMLKMDNNHMISWNLENANQVSATKDTYSVTYPEILSNTDLQYEPISDGLKENIILKNSSAPNVFTFDLKLDGLKPEQQNDGSIAIKDEKTNETEFVLPKPFMTDKNQNTSDSVDMTIENTDDSNIYTLTVTADPDWLNNPSTIYPVTIDPSALTANYFTTIKNNGGTDTYIASNTSASFSGSTSLSVGYDSNLHYTRALTKFNLGLPAGAIVTDAIFSMYKTSVNTADNQTLYVNRITSSWLNTVNWATKPSVDTSHDQTLISEVTINGNGVGWVNFNVFSIVKGWVNGGLANNGFMISYMSESTANPPFSFYSSEGSSTYGPMLSITYIPDEIGDNNFWGYANTSIGAVNTMNGNFITSTTDFSLPGRGMPINVTRTYNNRGNLSGIFGQKWFSNLDAHLEFQREGIVYIDSSGAERPYMLLNDDKTYSGASDYPVQLYKDTSTSTTVYRLQEANAEYNAYQSSLPEMVFNSNGKLIQLDDGKGNSTKIAWNSGNIVVTDPSGRTATLTLNSDGTVNNITTSAESGKVKAAYTYNNGYLASITYDNGAYPSATIYYEWNSGELISLTDKNGTKSYINYNDNNQAISIGTANMLSNPSMETDDSTSGSLDDWTNAFEYDNGSIKQSSTYKYGRYSMDIKSVNQSGSTSTGRLYATQSIPVSPNTTYTLSSFIKTNLLGGSSDPNPSAAKAFLNIRQLDSNGAHISWTDSRSQGISGTTD